jgi:hypothetical protein
VPDQRALADQADPGSTLRSEVERLTASFASYERPRRLALLPRALSIDQGELDVDGRPIRPAVLAHFPEQVSELFERTARDPAPRTGGGARRTDAAAEHHPEPTASASG